MTDRPFVSVGLPVYNGGRYLDETISSILAQDVPRLELIISDNASTDDTIPIIKQRCREDDRIRPVFSEYNHGAAWNFNNVLRLARGDYFHWSGYDDLMDPSMLRRCIGVLQDTEGAVLAYPKTKIIDADGALIEEYDNGLHLVQKEPAVRVKQYLQNIRMANPIFGVFSTESIRAAGGLGSYPSADLVTLARIAMSGKIVEISEPLFSRRIHETQSWRGVGLYEGFAEWFDTSAKKKIVFTDWRVYREMLGACLKEDLSFHQRICSLAAVLYWWPRRRWRALLREPLRIAHLFQRKK